MKGFLTTLCFGVAFYGAFNGTKIWYEACTGPHPQLIPLGIGIGSACWIIGVGMAVLGVAVYKSN